MASRTQLRLGQLTGSLGDRPGGVHDGRPVGEAVLFAQTLQSGSMVGLLSEFASSIKRIHNQDSFLNNSIGEFKTSITPQADTTFNLGSATLEWGETHTNAIKSAAALTLDAAVGGVSIDGTDDSNLTATGNGKDLDIAVVGGGTQELRIFSAGTGVDALHLSSSAGGIKVNSADMIEVNAADEIEIETTSADGHIKLASAHTTGVAFHIDANAAADSEVQIDAGILDIDVTGAATIDATALTVTSDTNTFTSANSTDPLIIIKNTNNDTNGARLQLVKDKGAAGATNDLNGQIDFIGDDANQDQVTFSQIKSQVGTATDGQEGGKFTISVAEHDGTLTAGLVIADGDADGELDVVIAAGAESLTTVSGDLTVTGDLLVSGDTTTVDTANLRVEDPIVLLAKNASSNDQQGGIAIASGSASGALSMVFGRVDDDTWGVGTKDVADGVVTTLADMTLGPLRVGKLELDGNTNHLDIASSNIVVTAAADIVLTAGGTDVIPGADKTHNLGSQAAQWKSLHVGMSTTGVSPIAQKTDGLGLFLDDDTDSGFRAAQDDDVRFVIGGSDVLKLVTGSLTPIADKYLDLGTSSLRYKRIHARTLSGSGGDAVVMSKNGTQQILKMDAGNMRIVNEVNTVDDNNTNGVIMLSDGFFSGSTLADGGVVTADGLPLALSRAEYDDYETNFGEVSLIGALVAARAGTGTGAGKFVKEITANVTAGTDVTIAAGDGYSALDWDTVTIADRKSKIDVYVNGQLLTSGSSGNDDYYLGTTADDLKFNFGLEIDDVVSVIIR